VSLGAGFLAYRRSMNAKKPQAIDPELADAANANAEPEEEPISASLAIDDVKIELGYGLLTLINDLDGRRLTDQIRALRKTLATEFGFVMPPVRILDNMRLANQGYAIRIKEMEAGAGEVRLGMLMAMDPRGGQVELPGEHVREPAFGLPATWVADDLREEATFRGYTIVDPATVLTTHLTEILKENMADLLSYSEVQKLLKELPEGQKKLVDDLIPSVATATTVQRVLQALLKERVSIRDLPQILEGIGEAAPHTSSVTQLVEQVRARLAASCAGPTAATTAPCRSSPCRPTGNTPSPSRWSARATTSSWPWPLAPAGFHPRRSRGFRARRAAGRGGRSADQPGRPTLCPLDHRALPRPDRGDEPERNPSARAAQDCRHGLAISEPTQDGNVSFGGLGLITPTERSHEDQQTRLLRRRRDPDFRWRRHGTINHPQRDSRAADAARRLAGRGDKHAGHHAGPAGRGDARQSGHHGRGRGNHDHHHDDGSAQR
jgi:hypothetical protein